MAVKKRFQPLMAELLIDHWQGRTLITLGREAFLWFAIGQPRDIKRELEAFWAREDRFEAVHTTPLFLPDGRGGEFRLAPLPQLRSMNSQLVTIIFEQHSSASEAQDRALIRVKRSERDRERMSSRSWNATRLNGLPWKRGRGRAGGES